MKIARILKYFGAVWLLSVSLSAHAVPFVNGDFSATTDWIDASDNGSASIVGGAAELVTGSGTSAFSAVFIQGDDGFFNFFTAFTLPTDVTTLTFDASFMDPGADTSETGGSTFTDELIVNVYDALDLNLDLYFSTGITSAVAPGFLSYSFDVSSLAGRDVALSFELSDEDDGRDSKVTIDNVVFNTAAAAIPEPGMLYLMSFGLLALLATRRKMLNSGFAA